MKKSDLVALLASLPDDIEVCIPAYEDGFVPISWVDVLGLGRYDGGDPWHGPLEEDEHGQKYVVLT